MNKLISIKPLRMFSEFREKVLMIADKTKLFFCSSFRDHWKHRISSLVLDFEVHQADKHQVKTCSLFFQSIPTLLVQVFVFIFLLILFLVLFPVNYVSTCGFRFCVFSDFMFTFLLHKTFSFRSLPMNSLKPSLKSNRCHEKTAKKVCDSRTPRCKHVLVSFLNFASR